MNKKQLSERDICTKFITPALKQAGWDITTQVREDFSAQQALKSELLACLGGKA